jgi:hypothetical protein
MREIVVRCRTNLTVAPIGLLFAIGLITHLSAVPAHACMAEYRSPDWQVANSPLIVIGEIEKIEDGKVSNAQMARDVPQPPPTKPTVATVRIVRLLKGQYPGTRLRIGSGPIRNCATWEVHCTFQKGMRMIFILPAYPNKGGEVALLWGASMRPLTDMQMVESRIARSIAYRDAYLNKLKKERPNIYAAAVAFADEMQNASQKWPEITFVEKGKGGVPVTEKEVLARIAKDKTLEWEISDQFFAAAPDIAKKVATTHIEVLRAAHAVRWLNQETAPWWDRYIWQLVLNEMARSREPKVAAYERARIRATLTDLGVEKDHIDTYLAAAAESNTFPDWSAFPPQLPDADFEKDAQSTHFIVQYFAYDRGAMFADYAISQGKLANLDPARVGYLIEALYHDDDQNLRLVAMSAISQIRGTAFVGVVLNEVVCNDQVKAWRCLVHPDDPNETATRLGAMIDLASKTLTPGNMPYLWHSLRAGGCFESACIEKAVAALAETEKATPKKKPDGKSESDADDAEHERESLVAALREYLAAARANRENAKPPTPSAAEYRQWFKTHPASTTK